MPSISTSCRPCAPKCCSMPEKPLKRVRIGGDPMTVHGAWPTKPSSFCRCCASCLRSRRSEHLRPSPRQATAYRQTSQRCQKCQRGRLRYEPREGDAGAAVGQAVAERDVAAVVEGPIPEGDEVDRRAEKTVADADNSVGDRVPPCKDAERASRGTRAKHHRPARVDERIIELVEPVRRVGDDR